jgi:hypothetical protein
MFKSIYKIPGGSQNRQKGLDLIPFFMSPDTNVYSACNILSYIYWSKVQKKNPLLSNSEISLGFEPLAVAKQFIHQGISFVNPAKEAIKVGYHIFL